MDWLALGGLVAGAIGGICGIIGIVFAWRADRRSKESGDDAQRSLELATDANTLSRESNSLAVDAKQLAEEANSISKRRELRETERHDVLWEIEREDPGEYRIVNVGDDEAFNVRVIFKADEHEARGESELVKPWDGVTLDLPSVRDEYAAELKKHRRSIEASKPYGINISLMPGPQERFAHFIAVTVSWQTALGQHRTEELKEPLSTFGEFDW